MEKLVFFEDFVNIKFKKYFYENVSFICIPKIYKHFIFYEIVNLYLQTNYLEIISKIENFTCSMKKIETLAFLFIFILLKKNILILKNFNLKIF